ncbi:MAG: endonuclease domain-containing protein [candidate division Zixibacteria bacterium]|nr:endonuclease domain-containing protein [candidate division Zixibacteria bacterium]
MTKIYNKSAEKQKRSRLRNQMSPAEAILWSKLSKRQVLGFKFRRQYGVGSYVLDFFCPDAKLAIEVDGDSHFQEDAAEYDGKRQAAIEKLGIHFLRFTNQEIRKNLFDVLKTITETVGKTGKQAGRKARQNTPYSPP